jgi:hypothetical protein
MSQDIQNVQALQAGGYGAGGDVLDWSFYDTEVITVANVVNRLFIAPQSATKTKDFTNMITSGVMPSGYRHTVRAIKTFYTTHAALATASVQALFTLLKTSWLELITGGTKVVLELTLQEAFGASLLAAVTPTAAGDNLPFPQPRFHGIFPLNYPLPISANMPFEVKVTHSAAIAAALAGDWLMISLAGKLERLS